MIGSVWCLLNLWEDGSEWARENRLSTEQRNIRHIRPSECIIIIVIHSNPMIFLYLRRIRFCVICCCRCCCFYSLFVLVQTAADNITWIVNWWKTYVCYVIPLIWISEFIYSKRAAYERNAQKTANMKIANDQQQKSVKSSFNNPSQPHYLCDSDGFYRFPLNVCQRDFRCFIIATGFSHLTATNGVFFLEMKRKLWTTYFMVYMKARVYLFSSLKREKESEREKEFNGKCAELSENL